MTKIDENKTKGILAGDESRTYLCIDLKSFYASVECIERGLDPLSTNLVVADPSRTEKTICLAVSPSLKSYGISGRARLFEVLSNVKSINSERLKKTKAGKFMSASYNDAELRKNPELELDFIIAPPRMAYYMDYSTKIYDIYLKYVAAEDIHVYSIDEVFIDLTAYLTAANMSAYEFAKKIIKDVLKSTGITATAGIGTNLYIAKIAMDIEAKHVAPDADGVRIAELNVRKYRENLWCHRPITDFWRVGKGYAKKLYEHGIYTMGDVALCSIGSKNDFHNEDLLYRLFGINAELLIDHAWGYEPTTISDIKKYKPSSKSISSGQVLHTPYESSKAKLVVQEMADLLVLDLVSKKLMTNQIILTVGYDIENLTDPIRRESYKGEISIDSYGREIPKHAHGTINLSKYTSSTKLIVEKTMELYDRIIDERLLVRRITITAGRVLPEKMIPANDDAEQLNLFTDGNNISLKPDNDEDELQKEKDIQKAVLEIKKKFGKNAILKGMNFKEGATAKDRNTQIGGHKA